MTARSPTAAKQRGMAIISALLIAAVVAVIAGGMLTRQTLFTRGLESEQLRVQGSWQLQGGMEVSRQRLWEDRQRDVLTRLDQNWARPIQLAALGPGAGPFEGRLEDEQSKFNLRNLLANDRLDPLQIENFQRLCELLGVSATLGQRISQRVIASYPRQLSPEGTAAPVNNGFQSGRDTSPEAARKPLLAKQPMLRSLDDLLGVNGVDEKLLARLQPFVTILPANTWVNGNTASAEVLAATVPGLALPRAKALIAERDSGQWFINQGDFINRLRMPQVPADAVRVGITSEWFRLQGQARGERRRVKLLALLHRSEDNMPRVIWSRVGV
ncbi:MULTISPECIES: type II secretion system minor pseudopilin GspK [Pseudomonas]|uniref:Type II secretion system protein K n=1 Tax=Pseudomonas gessardii TaxID=78544 RepID=A0A7Y1MMU9_9PSED|nr:MULTISPECIES: type II secretion system minor pseudopilin GspK [Pseudomonas]NNA94989.1 type II secretion system minor pseudopilin GspK [Pseudomonas gessardii]PMY59977.1 HxcX atypical pseudopilin [Pseudomonas sp. FW305-25]PMY61635.1 HxcX atypical pseudopilin [Pseudomonas sp. FW126-L8]PNA72099.1 HxcX atypical pseudopilin [Pseudomonas sp. FW305-76]